MLKTYVSENSLRVVGKAWQVRAVLKSYAESNATLAQFLSINNADSDRQA
ncbi:MAG TPA: Z-ring formation inhibitor MciZ [Bacilli bacterium]|nr:Z-ring formation inhibitor MciZ [Bacilli bacterium]